jgi:hypothetical protein
MGMGLYFLWSPGRASIAGADTLWIDTDNFCAGNDNFFSLLTWSICHVNIVKSLRRPSVCTSIYAPILEDGTKFLIGTRICIRISWKSTSNGYLTSYRMASNAHDKAPAVHKPSTAPRDAMTGRMTGTRRIVLSVKKQKRTPRYMPVLDNADPCKRDGKEF